jgi:hypothetical protein
MKRKTLWKSPHPSSGFLNGVALEMLPARACDLVFQYENEVGCLFTVALHFYNVVAFRCAYLPALSTDDLSGSYDQLIETDESDWLTQAADVMTNTGVSARLRHFQICFDAGPCYEFLCEGYEVKLR